MFYNEVVVEKSVDGSYFMACGWNNGYFGIQQLGSPDDKIVLFSVWDAAKGDDPNDVKTEDRVEVLYQGEGVRIKRFGGEGTGAQCLWKHGWQSGETNQFLIQADTADKTTAYTDWFKSTTLQNWKKLATFRAPHSPGVLRGYYSFIEDFRRDRKSANETHRARFGNGWIKSNEGTWLPLIHAKFTASNAEWESKENIDAGSRDGWFFLATGGDIRSSRKLSTTIDLPSLPSQSPPASLPNSSP